MKTIRLRSSERACDGVSRRDLIRVGALGFLGLSLPEFLQLEAAAAAGRARMIIGEEQAVGDLWDAAAWRLPVPREDRPGQPVYAIEEPPPPGDSGLRPATDRDLDRLVPACAAAHEEEIGIDPMARDPEGFLWGFSTYVPRFSSVEVSA